MEEIKNGNDGLSEGRTSGLQKMFGDEFENLSNEEKRAVVMKVLNDTLNQNPILMQTMGAAMQKEFCA